MLYLANIGRAVGQKSVLYVAAAIDFDSLFYSIQ